MWNELILANFYMVFSSLSAEGFSAEIATAASSFSPGILNLVGEIPHWQGTLCKQP